MDHILEQADRRKDEMNFDPRYFLKYRSRVDLRLRVRKKRVSLTSGQTLADKIRVERKKQEMAKEEMDPSNISPQTYLAKLVSDYKEALDIETRLGESFLDSITKAKKFNKRVQRMIGANDNGHTEDKTMASRALTVSSVTSLPVSSEASLPVSSEASLPVSITKSNDSLSSNVHNMVMQNSISENNTENPENAKIENSKEECNSTDEEDIERERAKASLVHPGSELDHIPPNDDGYSEINKDVEDKTVNKDGETPKKRESPHEIMLGLASNSSNDSNILKSPSQNIKDLEGNEGINENKVNETSGETVLQVNESPCERSSSRETNKIPNNPEDDILNITSENENYTESKENGTDNTPTDHMPQASAIPIDSSLSKILQLKVTESSVDDSDDGTLNPPPLKPDGNMNELDAIGKHGDMNTTMPVLNSNIKQPESSSESAGECSRDMSLKSPNDVMDTSSVEIRQTSETPNETFEGMRDETGVGSLSAEEAGNTIPESAENLSANTTPEIEGDKERITSNHCLENTLSQPSALLVDDKRIGDMPLASPKLETGDSNTNTSDKEETTNSSKCEGAISSESGEVNTDYTSDAKNLEDNSHYKDATLNNMLKNSQELAFVKTPDSRNENRNSVALCSPEITAGPPEIPTEQACERASVKSSKDDCNSEVSSNPDGKTMLDKSGCLETVKQSNAGDLIPELVSTDVATKNAYINDGNGTSEKIPNSTEDSKCDTSQSTTTTNGSQYNMNQQSSTSTNRLQNLSSSSCRHDDLNSDSKDCNQLCNAIKSEHNTEKKITEQDGLSLNGDISVVKESPQGGSVLLDHHKCEPSREVDSGLNTDALDNRIGYKPDNLKLSPVNRVPPEVVTDSDTSAMGDIIQQSSEEVKTIPVNTATPDNGSGKGSNIADGGIQPEEVSPIPFNTISPQIRRELDNSTLDNIFENYTDEVKVIPVNSVSTEVGRELSSSVADDSIQHDTEEINTKSEQFQSSASDGKVTPRSNSGNFVTSEDSRNDPNANRHEKFASDDFDSGKTESEEVQISSRKTSTDSDIKSNDQNVDHWERRKSEIIDNLIMSLRNNPNPTDYEKQKQFVRKVRKVESLLPVGTTREEIFDLVDAGNENTYSAFEELSEVINSPLRKRRRDKLKPSLTRKPSNVSTIPESLNDDAQAQESSEIDDADPSIGILDNENVGEVNANEIDAPVLSGDVDRSVDRQSVDKTLGHSKQDSDNCLDRTYHFVALSRDRAFTDPEILSQRRRHNKPGNRKQSIKSDSELKSVIHPNKVGNDTELITKENAHLFIKRSSNKGCVFTSGKTQGKNECIFPLLGKSHNEKDVPERRGLSYLPHISRKNSIKHSKPEKFEALKLPPIPNQVSTQYLRSKTCTRKTLPIAEAVEKYTQIRHLCEQLESYRHYTPGNSRLQADVMERCDNSYDVTIKWGATNNTDMSLVRNYCRTGERQIYARDPPWGSKMAESKPKIDFVYLDGLPDQAFFTPFQNNELDRFLKGGKAPSKKTKKLQNRRATLVKSRNQLFSAIHSRNVIL